MTVFDLALISFFAFFGALLFTPIVLRLCSEFHWMDEPNDRKIHEQPTAIMGGLSVVIGLLICLIISFVSWRPLSLPLDFLSVLAGSIVILLTGMYDDLYGLAPRSKLSAEMLAALIPVTIGFSYLLPYSWFSDPVSFAINSYVIFAGLFWVVGVTNAVNLSDGLDGLASGLVAISAGVISLFAIHNGLPYVLVTSSALALSTAGFLPFNLHQARIFLGDTGSLFMGFLLGTLTLMALSSYSLLFVLLVSPLIVGIPVFDTFISIVRRLVNNRPILESDQGHIHHRLVNGDFGYHRSVHFLWALQALSGSLALILSGLPWFYPVTALSFFSVLFLVPLSVREFALVKFDVEVGERSVVAREDPGLLEFPAARSNGTGVHNQTLQDQLRAGEAIRPDWEPKPRPLSEMDVSERGVSELDASEMDVESDIIELEEETEYEDIEEEIEKPMAS